MEWSLYLKRQKSDLSLVLGTHFWYDEKTTNDTL